MRNALFIAGLLLGCFGFLARAAAAPPEKKPGISRADSLQRYTAAALLRVWGNSKKWGEGPDRQHWQAVAAALDSNSLSAPADPKRITALMRSNGLGDEHDRIYRPMMRFEPGKSLPAEPQALAALFVDSLRLQLPSSDRADIADDSVEKIRASLNPADTLEKPVQKNANDSPAKAVIKKNNSATSNSFDEGTLMHGFRPWFLAALIVLVSAIIWFFIWKSRKQQQKEEAEIKEAQERRHLAFQEKAEKLNQQNSSEAFLKNSFITNKEASAEDVPERPSKLQKQEPTANVEPVEPVQPPMATAPEVFYMTVPGADGTFPTGAKKASPTGCLYRFEMDARNPNRAQVSFCGTETDMRNAQAFRDLELLPVCEFIGLPNINTFRFTEAQKGLAEFNGAAWIIKDKIKIRFIP